MKNELSLLLLIKDRALQVLQTVMEKRRNPHANSILFWLKEIHSHLIPSSKGINYLKSTLCMNQNYLGMHEIFKSALD